MIFWNSSSSQILVKGQFARTSYPLYTCANTVLASICYPFFLFILTFLMTVPNKNRSLCEHHSVNRPKLWAISVKLYSSFTWHTKLYLNMLITFGENASVLAVYFLCSLIFKQSFDTFCLCSLILKYCALKNIHALITSVTFVNYFVINMLIL